MSKTTTLNESDILDGLNRWSSVVWDNHDCNDSKFIKRFCPHAWDIVSVSWNCAEMKMVYILESGQHISDSVEIEEWLEFLKTAQQ